jgi:hypothetical protein
MIHETGDRVICASASFLIDGNHSQTPPFCYGALLNSDMYIRIIISV